MDRHADGIYCASVASYCSVIVMMCAGNDYSLIGRGHQPLQGGLDDAKLSVEVSNCEDESKYSHIDYHNVSPSVFDIRT